jgi:hypothetical protein
MPNWKKVIVSGSNASLNSLSAGDTSVTGSLNVYKSGSAVFTVEGSQGTLFSITDSLSGSLFSVADISGVPILEVFSDDTVKIGTYGNEAIVVSGDTAIISGSLTGSLNLDNVVNAGTDTDKFLVLDSNNNVDYRTGAQVYDDIGVTSLSSSIATDIAALDTSAGGGTIYTSNGNLTGDRTISGLAGSHSLSFNFLEFFAINNAAAISLEGGQILLQNLPTATGSALNNSLYIDSVSGEVKYAGAATLSSITANGASTTNTIRAGGLLVTGSVTISGSNTLINQGPAEFSGSVKVNTSDQVQASTDTDKFLVFDGDQIKYRSGTQVRSDIGATAPQSLQGVTDNGASTTNVIEFPNFTLNTPTNNNASSDKILVLDSANRSKIRTRDQLTADLGLDYIVTPLQLVVDTKNLSSGYVSWFGVSDLQSNADRGYTTWIAPTAGYIEKIIISPEQSNTTTANIDLGLYVGGTQQNSDVTVAMGAAGTNKTFTFGSANYSFTAGERLSIALDKKTNTADLYNMMVIIRLSN